MPRGGWGLTWHPLLLAQPAAATSVGVSRHVQLGAQRRLEAPEPHRALGRKTTVLRGRHGTRAHIPTHRSAWGRPAPCRTYQAAAGWHGGERCPDLHGHAAGRGVRVAGEQQQPADVVRGRGGGARRHVPSVVPIPRGARLHGQAQACLQAGRAGSRPRAAQRRLQTQPHQGQPGAGPRRLRPAQHVGVCGRRGRPWARGVPAAQLAGPRPLALTEEAAGEALRGGRREAGAGTPRGPACPRRQPTWEQARVSRGVLCPPTATTATTTSSTPSVCVAGPGRSMAPAPRLPLPSAPLLLHGPRRRHRRRLPLPAPLPDTRVLARRRRPPRGGAFPRTDPTDGCRVPWHRSCVDGTRRCRVWARPTGPLPAPRFWHRARGCPTARCGAYPCPAVPARAQAGPTGCSRAGAGCWCCRSLPRPQPLQPAPCGVTDCTGRL